MLLLIYFKNSLFHYFESNFRFYPFQKQVEKSSAEEELGGWPLCLKGHLLVHFGEGQSNTVLRPGDIYLYVRDSSSGVQLKAKLWTFDAPQVSDISIQESQYLDVFSMEWPARISHQSDDVLEELSSLVTCVENGIDRLAWGSIVGSAEPWSKAQLTVSLPETVEPNLEKEGSSQCQNKDDKQLCHALGKEYLHF